MFWTVIIRLISYMSYISKCYTNRNKIPMFLQNDNGDRKRAMETGYDRTSRKQMFVL